MELTPGERIALENLTRKAIGEDLGWINIANARALAERGLCARDRQGWRVSDEGKRMVGEIASELSNFKLQPTLIRPKAVP